MRMNILSIVILKFLISTEILNYINQKANQKLKKQNSAYIAITENLQIEGQQSVARSVHYTSVISDMLDTFPEASLSFKL